MKKERRQKVLLVGTVMGVLALLLGMVPASAAKQIKLVDSYWTPEFPWTIADKTFAKDFEKRTKGKAVVQLNPGASLGRPDEYYDMLRKGLTDMSLFAPSWQPGRFPMSSIMELPISAPVCETVGEAFWQMYKKGYFDNEFKEVKLLWLVAVGPYNFQFVKKPEPRLSYFRGKKFRTGGASGHVATLKAIGAIPVAFRDTEVYTALEKGIVDGNFQPYGAVKNYKLQEVAKWGFSVDSIYFTFAIAMNKEVWEGLPQDIKAIIDDMINSTPKYSRLAGKGHDEWCAAGKKLLKQAGGDVYELPPADMERFMELIKPQWDEWIADKEKKGLPGKKAVDDLYSILKNLGVKKPFIR